jgi:hypothetical protein
MLGDLSSSYESNGDPSCISDGYLDYGGKSYGMYQLSSTKGSVSEFISWLQQNYYWFGDELAKYEIGSTEFDNVWKWLGTSENKNDFAIAQHNYIQAKYYDTAIQILENNYYHIDNHHGIMKDVVWSRSVQYGPGYILEMFTDAVQSLGYPNLSYVDSQEYDKKMIQAIYLTVCSSTEWNNSALRDNLNQRFQSECNDALQQL